MSFTFEEKLNEIIDRVCKHKAAGCLAQDPVNLQFSMEQNEIVYKMLKIYKTISGKNRLMELTFQLLNFLNF